MRAAIVLSIGFFQATGTLLQTALTSLLIVPIDWRWMLVVTNAPLLVLIIISAVLHFAHTSKVALRIALYTNMSFSRFFTSI